MWPVVAFYDGSNELAEEELLLARVFREKGREDLARYVRDGRKVQRFLFALGSGGASHEDEDTLASLFIGLKRAFDRHERKIDEQRVLDEWKFWKTEALASWKHESLLNLLVNTK